MSSGEAIRNLVASGFIIVRQGKGSHVILQRGPKRLIIPGGKQELSSGMTAKVRSALARKKT